MTVRELIAKVGIDAALDAKVHTTKKKEPEIGFKDDVIFLLSKREYEKHKDSIPFLPLCWWLRSPARDPKGVLSVDCGGFVTPHGFNINQYYDIGVRPVIRINQGVEIGKKIVCYGVTWVSIGDGLAIAQLPIGFRRFDIGSNDYEHSEIRQFLLNWEKERRDLR